MCTLLANFAMFRCDAHPGRYTMFKPRVSARTRRRNERSRRARARLGHYSLERLERREVLDASLQVIHNSPYDLIGTFDVYVDDVLFFDDLSYHEATPFLTVPSDVDVDIDITDFDAPDNSAPYYTTTANFVDDSSNVAIAFGEPDAPPGPSAFQIAISPLGQQFALNPANVEILMFHGAQDTPPIDVVERGGSTWADDLSIGEFSPGYVSVAPDDYTLDATLGDGVTRIRSFAADLTTSTGGAFVLAASGWLDPPLGAIGDAPFDMLAAFPDGSAFLLPRVEPLVEGTNGHDPFNVQLHPGDPGIVQVTRGGQTTQFLAVTNPLIAIEGGAGYDSLSVRYSTAGPLPTIAFDGGPGYDTVWVYGTAANDAITLLETSDLSNLPEGVIALANVHCVTVWGRGGNDRIDASDLTTIKTRLYGGRGDDTILDGEDGDASDEETSKKRRRGRRKHDQVFDDSGRDWLSDRFDDWVDSWFERQHRKSYRYSYSRS